MAAQRYAVAVLDVKMPRISGLALKKLLEEKDPQLKFIFLTGHGSEEDFAIGSAEAGASYYLIKPVDLNLLIEKLKEIIQT